MSGDLDVLAGEYVLGTLDAAERTAFAARLAGDTDARHAVAAWERRLAPLGVVGDEVAPSASVWTRIAAGLRTPPTAATSAGLSPDVAAQSLAALAASRNRWRAATLAVALLGLLGTLAVAALRPGGDQRVLVAAINPGGSKPALMIRVDLATRRVSVRPIAATTPPGRSLQLWAVDAPAAPRSLGLVGAMPATLTMPAGAGVGTTFAVSVEPEGGSTTGGPTGPVVYAGQLVAE